MFDLIQTSEMLIRTVNEYIKLVFRYVNADNNFFSGNVLFAFHSSNIEDAKDGFFSDLQIRNPNGSNQLFEINLKEENDAPSFITVSTNLVNPWAVILH